MLADFFEPFALVRKTSRPNGLGGTVDTWEDIGLFQGGVTSVQGAEITVAGHQALRTVPVLVHEAGADLKQDALVRRASDGAFFRVTGNSCDMRTPSVAAVRFAQVPVERVVMADE